MKKISLLLFGILLSISAFSPRDITWVAIGDSITYLNDHPNETGDRITKGYLTLLTEKKPGVTYINKGFNGWTSIGIADKFDELSIPKGDVYTIFLGTNDWWQGKPVGTLSDYQNNTGTRTTSGAFRIIIDKIKQLNPAAKIILMTPLQRGDFVYIKNYKNNAHGSYKPKNDQELLDFVNAIQAIGKLENIAVVDLYRKSGINQKNMVKFKMLKDLSSGQYKNYKYPAYTTVAFNPETDKYPYPMDAVHMTYDGLHPSDKGYEKIVKALLKKW